MPGASRTSTPDNARVEINFRRNVSLIVLQLQGLAPDGRGSLHASETFVYFTTSRPSLQSVCANGGLFARLGG